MELIIEQDHFNNQFIIYILEKSQSGRRSVLTISNAEKGVIESTTLEDGCIMSPQLKRPFLTLPILFAEDFFKNLIKELHNSGYKMAETMKDGQLAEREKRVIDLKEIITLLINKG